MSFMDKVSVIVKLNQDTKAIASVFGKKDGRQVRNDLAVHLAVSRWPEDVRRQLKQADLKWFKPCKPLSQTIVKSLTKHKEMGKYVREGVSILFTEGVKAYKDKLSLWMREEGVGKFRRATPPEVDGLVPLENDAAIENEHVFKSQFNVGDVVLAKWSDGNMYDAKIKKVEIVYHVQYVEDKVHKKVSQEDVQKK